MLTGPWFTLDAANRKLRDHQSYKDAHAAVKAGTAAAFVGHVKPGIVAVDIDLDDADTADDLLSELESFCDDFALWTHERLSGGGPGRRHFFIAAGAHQAAVVARVTELRGQYGLTSKEVDIRQAIRALASPHRSGTAAPMTPLKAVESFPRHLTSRARRTPAHRTQSAAHNPSARLTPSQLSVFRMEPFNGDRSFTEWRIARQLKSRGASPDAVWNALTGGFRKELGHAAERGYGWFLRYWWEPADKPRRPRPEERPDRSQKGPWNALVLAASLALRDVWDVYPTRSRHTLEHVLMVAAQRITRNGGESTPLPLRDMRADTGLSLPTISKQLKELCSIGLLTKSRTFTYAGPVESSSDEYELGPMVQPQSVSFTPELFTPAPAASPLWVGLGSAALSYTITLMHHGTTALGKLLHLHSSGESSSTTQRSHVVSVLSSLAERKVIKWNRKQEEASLTDKRSAQPRAGMETWRRLREENRAERQEFRTFIEEARATVAAAWEEQKACATEATRAANRLRQRAWWASLSVIEKAQRSKVWAEAWAQYSPQEKAARREWIARQRPAQALAW